MAAKRKKSAPLQWWKTLESPKWRRTSWRKKWVNVFRLFRERSAFLYEVGARVNATKGVLKYEFGKPWIELTVAQKRILARRWPMPNTRETSHGQMFTDAVCSLGSANSKPEQGWTGYCNVSYNLQYNDETIAKTLLRFIARERKRLGIPNPKRNAGRRFRERSWMPIEIMDRRIRGDVLNCSERSQASKAKAAYRKSLASI